MIPSNSAATTPIKAMTRSASSTPAFCSSDIDRTVGASGSFSRADSSPLTMGAAGSAAGDAGDPAVDVGGSVGGAGTSPWSLIAKDTQAQTNHCYLAILGMRMRELQSPSGIRGSSPLAAGWPQSRSCPACRDRRQAPLVRGQERYKEPSPQTPLPIRWPRSVVSRWGATHPQKR